MNDKFSKQINEAIRMAIEEETPKLKKGQTLKVDIKTVDEGVKVHVYPVDKGGKS